MIHSSNAVRQHFPSVESFESWHPHGDAITVPASALAGGDRVNTVRVVFATYNRLEQLLSPR